MQEPCVCDCGELAELSDMTECGVCQKTKCVDCFAMDEDAEMCDQCVVNDSDFDIGN